MTDMSLVVARILAATERRAVPIRRTSLLASDPTIVFGFAPIRLVSEQRVYAIAFGDVNARPGIVTSWNPLGRESASLEPFAVGLDSYISQCVQLGIVPRLWLPHPAALEVMEVLAERYRRNQSASPALRRMGWILRVLVDETEYPGQQVVAVATLVLANHVVTGQSPIEDRHLGAILAWVTPSGGVDPAVEADRRALSPAAAMLDRATDDQVDRLRGIAKRGGHGADAARARIEVLLAAAANREWNLLVAGRAAFEGLHLPPVPRVDGLVTESRRRLAFAMAMDLNRPTRPHSLAALLDEQEDALSVAEEADVRGDESARARARRAGRAFAGRIVAVRQPTPNRHPCNISVHTEQTVLRVRRGTKLQTVDGLLAGRVQEVREDSSGGTIVEVKLASGVQRRRLPVIGSEREFTDAVVFGGAFRRREVYQSMRSAASAIVYGDALPLPRPRSVDTDELVALAESRYRS